MAKLDIVTKHSTLVDSIDLDDWDFDKPIARAAFLGQVFDLIERAREVEKFEDWRFSDDNENV